VKIAFLDDAGRSRRDPIVLVGGVLVDGEDRRDAVARRLDAIAAEFIPEADRDGFVFHAKDIFHGGGYFKDPLAWPRERRWPILWALIALPGELGVPVVFGHLDRAQYASQAIVRAPGETPRRADLIDLEEHAIAFAKAETAIGRHTRESSPNETRTVVAEDNGRMKQAVETALSRRRTQGEIAPAGAPHAPATTAPFAARAESRPLQLAEMCAFFILRRLTRQQSSQPFFEALTPQLEWNIHGFGEPMGSEPAGMGRLH